MSSVQTQLLEGDELIVVIDHNPALLDAARVMLAPISPGQRNRVRLIANENPAGLSGARNAGITASRGELLVFLDDDAVPRPGWLAQLTGPFAAPDVIGTGGVAEPVWLGRRPAWLPDEFLWVVGCSYRGLPQQPAEIRNPIGANMAFRRRAIDQVGGFTDGIGRVGRVPLGCEETELSIRARRETDGRIVQQPSAIVDHRVSADRIGISYFVRRCWAEGISKAVVSRSMGGNAALSSERSYMTRTLPAGVLIGIRDGCCGNRRGFQRAAMIVAGLAITVAGYLRGAGSTLQPQAAEPGLPSASDRAFTPIWTGELDLAAPSLPDPLTGRDGEVFQQARILIRAEGTPLGFVELETPGGRTDLGLTVQEAQRAFNDAATDALSDTGWTTDAAKPISVVVCTHSRSEGLRRTLDSLLAVQHRQLEIIVVDNAPVDDSTRDLVAELAGHDERLRYVREPRQGLSCARNCGLREAGGEIVAFTDDDVRVDPLWLHGLLRGFARRPAVACVTGLVASASLSRPAEQYFDQRVWWSSSCEQRLFSRTRRAADSPLHPYMAGAFGTGANFAARTSALRAVGGFDECLGAGSPTRGGEDLDIFVRLLRAGWELSYEPSALVWHEHRVDDDSLRNQMYAYGLGLTAYLTKYLLARRSRTALLYRLPGALRHALVLRRRSQLAAERATLAQRSTTGVELRGMLAGPLAYIGARRRADAQHLRAVAP